MDEMADLRDPGAKAAADQLHAKAIDGLRTSKAFMLVTLDTDGKPFVYCTSTETLMLGETVRFTQAIAAAGNKCIQRLNEGIEASIRRLGDEEAA